MSCSFSIFPLVVLGNSAIFVPNFYNHFIINNLTSKNMKKITLLLATLFAFVVNTMAALPTNDTFGYLTNKASSKSVNASAKVADEGVIFKITDMKACGDSFGSDDGSIKESGYTYARFLLKGTSNYMRVTKSGISCSGSGYHKWAIMDTDKGLVLRCIYSSTQSDAALDPFAQQGYYLTAAEDGSLILVETPIEASYWFFDTEKAEKEIAEAEEAEIKATQEKLKDMKAGDDITALLIQNANFDDGTNGWTVNNGKIEVKAASSGNPVVTAYNYTFDISQSVKGATKGWYQLKVQAFSRSAANADVLKLLEAGTELENNCYIYGNTEEKKVVLLTDEMQKEKLTDYKEYTYNGETIDLPDGSTAFAAAFTKGLYENDVKFEVGDDGILKFGIKNTKSPSEQGPTYCGYDNFRLIYLGTDPATAISSVSVKTTQKAIFNVAGQQMSGLQKGINIVDGKKIYLK